MFRKGIVFTGSGGQGVITASIILAEAALLHDGLNAVQAQAYGPEARGGATRADVIISDEEIRYPKVIQPNVLICLTQAAYNKYGSIVRPGGIMLTDSFYVREKSFIDAQTYELDMYRRTMDELKKPIVFNITMLGALIGLTKVVNPDSIARVVARKVPAEFMDLNKQALELGLTMAREQLKKQG